MQSSNPVFRRADGFNGAGRPGHPAYPGADLRRPAGHPGPPGAGDRAGDQGRMTIDSVVQKTGLTLGVVVLFAAATWIITPEITTASAMGTLYPSRCSARSAASPSRW